jgi:hypothetical protein
MGNASSIGNTSSGDSDKEIIYEIMFHRGYLASADSLG